MYIYRYIYLYLYIYKYKYIYMCLYMYICICIHIHVYTYVGFTPNAVPRFSCAKAAWSSTNTSKSSLLRMRYRRGVPSPQG